MGTGRHRYLPFPSPPPSTALSPGFAGPTWPCIPACILGDSPQQYQRFRQAACWEVARRGPCPGLWFRAPLPAAQACAGPLLEDFQAGISPEPFGERADAFVSELVLLQAADKRRGGSVEAGTVVMEEEVAGEEPGPPT